MAHQHKEAASEQAGALKAQLEGLASKRAPARPLDNDRADEESKFASEAATVATR